MSIIQRINRLVELTGEEARAVSDGKTAKLSNPAGWFTEMFSTRTRSGLAVNEKAAMRMTTVWSCITLVSETVAQLPINLYERDGNKKTAVHLHPAGYLLKHQPNPWQTSFQFRETSHARTMGWGNSYSLIVRRKGRPIALIPLLPAQTNPLRKGSVLQYQTVLPDGEVALFDAQDILHIPALSFDGIEGISPLRNHAESIGLALAAQEFGARFYGNGANLSAVITSDKKIEPDVAKTIGDRFKQAFSGLSNSHDVAVLGSGTKFERTGIPQADAQYLETRKFQRSEIASIYKIPPHMIGDLEKSSFNNITEMSIQYVRYAVAPWLRRWEDELNRKFFPNPEDRLRFYFKFELDALLRGTPKERSEFYKAGITDGWINRNEVRDKEDMDPVDGLDSFLVPMNMEKQGENKKGKVERVGFEVFRPLIGRFAEQLANADTKACTRGETIGDIESSVRSWRDSVGDFVVRHLSPSAETMEGCGVDVGGLVAAVAAHHESIREFGDEGVENLPVVTAGSVERFIFDWLEGLEHDN